MKKALKILGIAIVAAAVFAGCEQGPQEVDAKVTYKQGTMNYDFEGKLLTHVDISYITKTVTVTDTDPLKNNYDGYSTVTNIAYKSTTTTLAFADTDEYTKTVTTLMLDGANGDYRSSSVTTGTVTTSTVYTIPADMKALVADASASGRVQYAGLAGMSTTVVTSGTWSSFKNVDSPDDSVTLEYAINTTTTVTTTPTTERTDTAITPTTGYVGADNQKFEFKVSGNPTITTSNFDTLLPAYYRYTGETTVDEEDCDVVWFTTTLDGDGNPDFANNDYIVTDIPEED